MASDDHRQSRQRALRAALAERILILDGAMGTMIQDRRLSEPDYRGERLRDHPHDLKGNNDILNLSRPDVIRGIHDAFLAVGADILETNTFNATSIAQADYGTEDLVPDINREGARIARAAADAAATPDKPRFVAGALGPTNRTASISPDVNDPGYRNTSFDALRLAYRQAAEALVAGGVDLLLLETVFDTLNAKAALFALDELFEAQGFALPVMVSGTITDRSGRTLSGQTVEAFWNSVRHAHPFTIGLNCALGPDLLRAHVAEMARVAEAPVCAYPNAGLPNEMGEYEETPAQMAAHIGEWARAGLLNVVGGCCGTTPAHIDAIARAVDGVAPRVVPHRPKALRLAGLEAFTVSP